MTPYNSVSRGLKFQEIKMETDIREQYRALIEESERVRKENDRFWRNLGLRGFVLALAALAWLEWVTA